MFKNRKIQPDTKSTDRKTTSFSPSSLRTPSVISQTPWSAGRNSVGPDPIDDKPYYAQAMKECEGAEETRDPGLWAKAFSLTEGDANRAKAKYIELRVADLVVQEQKRQKERQDLQALNALGEDGMTPLIRLIERGKMDIITCLVAKGAKVDVRDKDGKTPLRYAAYCGRLDVAKFLVAYGADVNAMANDGMTPLMRAAAQGHLDMVEFLQKNGADVNAKDNNGWTPLKHAKDGGERDVAEFLIQHGAKE